MTDKEALKELQKEYKFHQHDTDTCYAWGTYFKQAVGVAIERLSNPFGKMTNGELLQKLFPDDVQWMQVNVDKLTGDRWITFSIFEQSLDFPIEWWDTPCKGFQDEC